MRWPDGFVCPACGHEKGWALQKSRDAVGVGRHQVGGPEPDRCTAACWLQDRARPSPEATHSALQAARRISKRCGCSPTSLVDAERNPLSGLVEIDEASLPFRTKAILPPEGKDEAVGKMLIVGAISNSGTPGACGWPKSPRPPPTSDTSSLPPIPTPSRKPTAGPATLRSPPIATMSMSSENRRSPRPAVEPSLLQPQRMGARHSTTGCVASICRPISMSSSRFNLRNPPRCFPALPPRHQCRTPYLQHVASNRSHVHKRSGNYMARLQFGCAGTQGALLEDEFGEIGL